MSFVTDIEISDSLKQTLRAVGSIDQRAMTPVLLAAAQVVRNAAIPIAPYEFGTLRRSIRTEPMSDGSVVVGSDVPYARRFEFGFVGPDKLGRHYHQAARPYLRPAFDTTRREQLEEANAAARDLLGNLVK